MKKKRVMRKLMSCCRHVKVNNAVTSFFYNDVGLYAYNIQE